MKIKVKDPARTQFVLTLLIVLGCLVVGAFFLYIGYIILGGAGALLRAAGEFVRDLWHKDKFDCLMLFVAVGMVFIGLISAPFVLLEHFKKWRDPQRMRSIEFAPEGIFLTTDIRIFLPYEQTSLNLLLHVTSHYNHKNRVRTASLAYVKMVFTFENATYAVKHIMPIKQLYALADMHARFSKFSFNTTLEHPDTEEEITLAKHLLAQVENQIRYGMHCRFANRGHLIFSVVVMDVIATFLCVQGVLAGKISFFIIAAGILFAISGVLLFAWARDTQRAKEIARLQEVARLAGHLEDISQR